MKPLIGQYHYEAGEVPKALQRGEHVCEWSGRHSRDIDLLRIKDSPALDTTRSASLLIRSSYCWLLAGTLPGLLLAIFNHAFCNTV
jgi:hypothetical protein